MKGKEEPSERVLNEIGAGNLSHTEFKTMAIRKLNELTENYQKLQGSYKDITVNYPSMEKLHRKKSKRAKRK